MTLVILSYILVMPVLVTIFTFNHKTQHLVYLAFTNWHKTLYPYNNIINALNFICVSVFVCVGQCGSMCA